MLLAFSFCFLFLCTFAAAAVAIRPARDRRLLDARLQTLLTSPQASSFGTTPLLKTVPKQPKTGLLILLSDLAPVRAWSRLVYQSTGSRSLLPTIALTLALAFMGALATVLITSMLPAAALVALFCSAIPTLRLRHVRRRKLDAFNKALPDCIDLCARSLRAGHSLIAAIGIAAEQAPEPARKEFVEIFRKQNFGLPLREALLETLEQLPSADFRVFVTGILVQKDTGGNLTDIFDRIVNVMRERLRIEGEIRIHTAQGRMTAWILTLLPPVLFVIINLLNPGYSRPMFTESIGRTLFYFGLGSLVVGGLLVRHIVNGIEV